MVGFLALGLWKALGADHAGSRLGVPGYVNLGFNMGSTLVTAHVSIFWSDLGGGNGRNFHFANLTK